MTITLEQILSEADKIKKSRVQSSILQPDMAAKLRVKNIVNITNEELEALPMTPYAKNAALEFMDIKDGEKIKIDAPTQKWEANILSETYKILLKHYGEPVTEYSLVSQSEYPRVDAWRNFFKMGREVTKGAALRRNKTLDLYLKPVGLKFSPTKYEFEKAINIISSYFGINTVSHVDNWPRGHVPFSGYHTNVGWRYFIRDNTKLKGLTGEQLSLNDAKKIEMDDIHNLPAIMFGRDQRSGFEHKITPSKCEPSDFLKIKFKDSKARVVWGTSRTGNYWLAKDINPLINYSKSNNLFFGYNNREYIRGKLAAMDKSQSKFKVIFRNADFSGYDYHLTAELLVAGSLVLENAIKTSFGKRLIKESAKWAIKMPIFNTPDMKLKFKNGALPSGILQTNLLGGIINAIISCYALIKMYPDFDYMLQKFVTSGLPFMSVMGDDNLSFVKQKTDMEKFNKILQSDFGIEANPNKGEHGLFFLQMRYHQGKILVPSPRVISKCFWIERPKGLGPMAWTLATWMKLYNIHENPEFEDVVRLIVKYDKSKLGTINPDNGAIMTKEGFRSKLSAESREQNLTDLDRVGTGNPSEDDHFKNGQVKSEFINFMWSKISSAIK